MRVVLFALCVGCYNPAPYLACETQCTSDQACQPGFICGAAGRCRAEGDAECLAVDAGTDADPPGMFCLGTGLLRPCLPEGSVAGLPDRTVSSALLLDTDDDAQCEVAQQVAGPEVCVLWSKNLTVTAGRSISARGSRPLVLVAVEALTVTGVIDVASSGGVVGAGSLPPVSPYCKMAVAGTQASTNPNGAGGGAGGSRSTAGGAGGTGAGATPGAMGTPVVLDIAAVQGGCSGGTGGAFGAVPGGAGGRGGGAVYLIAGGTLKITGIINASGAGGAIPPMNTGGAGGGSGGFIGLDAPNYVIDAAARIFASGGSGASGGSASLSGLAGTQASPDADPMGSMPAEGGGRGGNGGSVAEGGAGGKTTVAGCGGGGGGGGGGVTFIAGAAPVIGAPTFRPLPKQR